MFAPTTFGLRVQTTNPIQLLNCDTSGQMSVLGCAWRPALEARTVQRVSEPLPKSLPGRLFKVNPPENGKGVLAVSLSKPQKPGTNPKTKTHPPTWVQLSGGSPMFVVFKEEHHLFWGIPPKKRQDTHRLKCQKVRLAVGQAVPPGQYSLPIDRGEGKPRSQEVDQVFAPVFEGLNGFWAFQTGVLFQPLELLTRLLTCGCGCQNQWY